MLESDGARFLKKNLEPPPGGSKGQNWAKNGVFP